MGNSCFLTCPRRAAAFPHMPPVDNSCSLTASHTRRGPRVFRRNNLCEARAGSERPEHDRGADAAEDGGQIGDGADGGVVVARFVLPGEHRFRGNGFRGKNGADAFAIDIGLGNAKTLEHLCINGFVKFGQNEFIEVKVNNKKKNISVRIKKNKNCNVVLQIEDAEYALHLARSFYIKKKIL